MRVRRPKVPSLVIATLTASYVLISLNMSFWSRMHVAFAKAPWVGLAVDVAYAAVIVALCIAVSAKYLIKPALIVIVLLSATSAYFADDFGVLITRDVIRDVFTTTQDEAQAFFSPAMVRTILIFGVAPSLLIAWVRVQQMPLLRKAAFDAGAIALCMALAAVLLLGNLRTVTAAVAGHRELLQSSNPIGPITSVANYASLLRNSRRAALEPIGQDARRGPIAAAPHRPWVTVIVVGESVRAENFGLDGYLRDTTPELRAARVINYANATSCGTSTAVSLPCMFSMYGRAEYSERKIEGSENLLDVLARVGVRSVWWENQTGSKNVADRSDYRKAPVTPEACPGGGECLDQALLEGLGHSLDEVKGDSVILLHQHGSHGPTYFRQYPVAFRRFVPECTTAQLVDCSKDEVVDAYDNSILYTDHILGEVIGALSKRRDRIDAAMFYMSDHGESLGEGGLYMHGTPYAIAPPQQTHIPFLLWVSDELAADTGVDLECLRGQASLPVSHDNLFSSVLGLMDVTTLVRKPGLDLFAKCRIPPV